jgi:hypothetical protein
MAKPKTSPCSPAAAATWPSTATTTGRIDSGSELFGPATGSGFGELAALDGDGNGWIDENDDAFARLRGLDAGRRR